MELEGKPRYNEFLWQSRVLKKDVQNVVRRTHNGETNSFDHMIFPAAATKMVKMQDKFEAKRKANQKHLSLPSDMLMLMLKSFAEEHGYSWDTPKTGDPSQITIRYQKHRTSFDIRQHQDTLILSVPDMITPSYFFICAMISVNKGQLELCNGNRCARSPLAPVFSFLDLMSYHDVILQNK